MKLRSPKDRGSWEFKLLSHDRLWLKREKSHTGYYENFEVQGNFAVITLVHQFSGQLAYIVDGKEVHPAQVPFALFLPPYSIAKFTSTDMAFLGNALVILNPPKVRLQEPTLAEAPLDLIDDHAAGFDDYLSRCSNLTSISPVCQTSSLARRVKQRLSQTYATDMSLAELAKELQTSPSVMTRTFKKEFCLTPNEYRKRLRLADAGIMLAIGNEIDHVVGKVGYEDLSHFYKHFKEMTTLTPGAFKKSKNPKKK